MLIIILILIVGSMLVYVSKYNFQLISVNLGFYVAKDIPLFYVIIISLLIGLILSYLIYLVNSISNSFVLRGKNNEIKKNKLEALELTKRVHQLEIKNEKMGNDSGREPRDTNAL